LRQVLQNMRTGQLSVDDVPQPAVRPRGILVRTEASLVSAGTERMLMRLAKKGLLGKAKERPDLVRKVLTKLSRDGFTATFQAVRDRLDREVPLGYSACGRVEEVGAEAREFEVAQRVACAGAGYANHAEVNYVPKLLAVAVPEGVSTEAAAYSTVGAIALQGIRNADVRGGETVAVIGLGLIGQLSVQILKAFGCRVVGLDISERRVEQAASQGADLALALKADGVEDRVHRFTRGRGADAVLITAATSSNAPVEIAARLARDRARVVMVGVTGMDVPRKTYYEKELTFVVSRSYGPGRYDPAYEEQGHDYPAGHVRWTETRNIEAFLDLAADGRIHPESCTTHRFPIAEAERAYELILKGSEPHLGVILTYPQTAGEVQSDAARLWVRSSNGQKERDCVRCSFVGAGSFARGVLLPALKKVAGVRCRGIVSASGVSAKSAAKKFGFEYCSSAADEILGDPDTDALFIATPHSQHADMVCRALESGKAVFVEKPLATSVEQLVRVRDALDQSPGLLMVGFNRRFSRLAVELKEYLRGSGPLTVNYRCNAGPLPEDHWIADPSEGGRIVGEACHFFDFFAFLTDSEPERVWASPMAPVSPDDMVVTVSNSDGSVCQLTYVSSGPAALSKERVEVIGGGRVGIIEDFRTLMLARNEGAGKKRKLLRSEKGHLAEMEAFVRSVKQGSPAPISPESLLATTSVSLAAVASARSERPVPVSDLQEI